MKRKSLILSVIAFIAAVFGAQAQEMPATYIQRPIVPDSISTLAGRCNYVADHFFDFCDLKKAFSSRARMGDEIRTYLEILPQASPERAQAAASRLMEQLAKQPADQLYVATLAEEAYYSDSAAAWYDRLYLPFASAVADNKKIQRAEKARFVRQAKVLEGSLIGSKVAPLEYVTPSGERRNLDMDNAEAVLVMLADPTCSDCSMARLRLDADASLRELVDEGRFKVVVIGIADPADPEWQAKAAEMPSSWTVGANPDVDTLWDMRVSGPSLFIFDRKHNLRWKHLTTDMVLDIARQIKKR
ncbi:MAG: DUF5106 domain-containing protein [Duncaniella sp.]|nr:DUF5106 domain-containing protein [Duncaniella sp.]